MMKKPTPELIETAARISFQSLSRNNPEAKAHLERLEGMVHEGVIGHHLVQDVLRRQVMRCLRDIYIYGMHTRTPTDDRELMLATNLALEDRR